MRLVGANLRASPAYQGYTRLETAIHSDRTGETREIWFDVPAEFESALTPSGNAWAVLTLPWACMIGESITLSTPVDEFLLNNLRGAQRIWKSWYPKLSEVAIDAPIQAWGPSAAPSSPDKRTAAFFSGGIDSLFTLLRHKDRVAGDGWSTIDDLITVAGFNTTLDDFETARRSLEPVAEKFGKQLIPLATNLRYSTQKTVTPYSDPHLMDHLAHGAALAAIGHLLGHRYKEVMIAATQDYGSLIPWGSHPFTDPLFGSRTLRIVHDGAAFNRVERTMLVAESDTALAVLHVCWQDRKDGNCSQCRKCLRTMATLDLLGARSRAASFDWSGYDMDRLGGVWLKEEKDINFFLEIAAAAKARGREDIANASMKSVRFSRRKRRVLSLIDSNALTRRGWQVARKVRSVILERNSVTDVRLQKDSQKNLEA